jgi:hypothetical protein
MNLVNTSTTPGTRHFTVFSPPLRSQSIGFDAKGPLRRIVKDAKGLPQQGLILTADDIRDTSGNRLYPLMPLENLGAYASIYTGFGKNATNVVQRILMTDVKAWDGETLINELRKDAKYSLPFFPKGIGLEIAYEQSKGNNKPYDEFLNRFTTYLVLVKCIMILSPEEFLGGQGKAISDVEAYLVRQRSRGLITEETEHVIAAILKELFFMEVFGRELGEKIVHQFEKYLQFK